MTRKSYAYALGPLALLGGVAGRCTPTPPTCHPTVIVGDSISADTRDEYENSIPGVLVDAIWGRGLDTNALGATFPTFREAIPGDLKKVCPDGEFVIQDDGGEMLWDLDDTLWVESITPDTVELVWVSPSNKLRPYIGEFQDNVRTALAEHPEATYVDWVAAATPDLLTDGLHANQDGQYVLNHLVWEATR